MKKIFLFSFAQLMKLVGLLKPLVELIKSIIDVFKNGKEEKEDNPNEEKVESSF